MKAAKPVAPPRTLSPFPSAILASPEHLMHPRCDCTITVSNGTPSIAATPTAADAAATLKVNGQTVASGSSSGMIPPAPGDNLLTVKVTAQDGATVKDYFVTVTRTAQANTPPIAQSQIVRVTAGLGIPIILAGSDADGNSLTFGVRRPEAVPPGIPWECSAPRASSGPGPVGAMDT